MSLPEIRRQYGVPAWRNARVRYTDPSGLVREGTVHGACGGRLRIQLDGDRWAKRFHPTWNLEYLERPPHVYQKPPEPTIEWLREHYALDVETGVLTRKTTVGKYLAGSEVGAASNRDYRKMRIHRKNYLVHRIIFAIHHGRWPEGEVDHINRNRQDNRPANLREATRAQNRFNIPMRCNNTSGFKGVTRSGNRWAASIRANNKSHRLGSFSTPEEASAAYEAAAARLHGEFAYKQPDAALAAARRG
jgi:hypothetical protein